MHVFYLADIYFILYSHPARILHIDIASALCNVKSVARVEWIRKLWGCCGIEYHLGAFERTRTVQCPYCNGANSKVTDSRSAEDSIRRRRECVDCGHRFTTYERIESIPLQVIKRDGQKQEFQRSKLLSSIAIACAKRPIPSRSIDRIVQDVERQLHSLGRSEVPTVVIGEMVMEYLRGLDWVAYVRWASVYRDFQDLESFEQVVEDLRKREGQPQDSIQLTLMDQGPAKLRRARTKTRRRSNGTT